jgi:hypothetical protein
MHQVNVAADVADTGGQHAATDDKKDDSGKSVKN